MPLNELWRREVTVRTAYGAAPADLAMAMDLIASGRVRVADLVTNRLPLERAAEIYQARASYRIELALYGALPVSILLLGQMVLWQAIPLIRSMTWMMDMLGATGSGGN